MFINAGHRSLPNGALGKLSAAFVLSFLMIMMAWIPGCANSAYRRVLKDLDRPTTTRLAERVESLNALHQKALEHFTDSVALASVPDATSPNSTDTRLRRFKDALDQCEWYQFEISRKMASLDDLVTQSDPSQFPGLQRALESHSPSRYAEFRTAATHAQTLMQSTRESLGSGTTDSQTSSQLDLLKEAIHAVQRSAALLATALMDDASADTSE